MKSYHYLIATLVILACSVTTSGESLLQLDNNNLLLLNVAAKSRLVERLTDAITQMETLRGRMVDYVKDCLVNVSSSTQGCRSCVQMSCQQRASECDFDIHEMQVEPEVKSIPGVTFLNSPVEIAEGIDVITKEAHDDMLDEIPPDLQSKGEIFMKKAEEKINKLQETLKSTVQELPGLLPRMKTAIQKTGSDFDPDELVDLADRTIGTLTKAFTDSDIESSVNVMVGQMPGLLNQVNQKMQQMSQLMGNLMSHAATKLTTILGNPSYAQQAPTQVNAVPQNLNQQNVNMQPIQTGNTDPNWQHVVSSASGSTDNGQWAVRRVNMAGNNVGGGAFVVSHIHSGFTRLRRSAPVECEEFRENPEKVCHNFHFRCSACMDESVILKEACGKEAIKMMVAIRRLDIKAAEYLMMYTKYVKEGLIVKGVEYDPNSFDPRTGVYKSAYLTIKLRDELLTYETTSLPGLSDLATSGGEVGDEIWMMLDRNDGMNIHDAVRQTSRFAKKNSIGVEAAQEMTSSAAMNNVVYGMMSFIMYLGFIVL